MTQMTNADRIRALTDEKLAEILKEFECPPTETDACAETCTKCWLKWLQQPVDAIVLENLCARNSINLMEEGAAHDQAERVQFRKWANSLSDAGLEKAYYDMVYSTLGSVAEEMYEHGWDMADNLEQEKYERDLDVQSRILEELCAKRGIKLWKDGGNNA